MNESDIRYYERRLAEELAEMKRSEEREVQAVHRKLAELYRQRIANLSAGTPA
jgi:hypothetical protein